MTACSNGGGSRAANPASVVVPPAEAIPVDDRTSESVIRFLEDRVKKDPDDFIAHNKLAGCYLQRQRETGDLTYLDLASRAAKNSLKAMPAEMNVGGLALLTETECVAHEFVQARDHAKTLVEYEPSKNYPYQILSEALLELGDYVAAETILKKARTRGTDTGLETRMAQLALLKGNPDDAQEYMARALAGALDQYPPSREQVAWCRRQLAEIAFSVGDYETAEKHVRDALTTYPDYYRALGTLAKVLAAKGDLSGAVETYEKAVRIIPDPVFVVALGDLYKLTGREADAQKQYALVEQIGKLAAVGGDVYNRQLARFYADHDLKPEVGYELAAKEYQVRRDVYGADTLAWTALKAGKIPEAQAAIKDALRLGTKDANLFYHAGMIARAAGDTQAARDFLGRALKLNPKFDPLQAPLAEKTLGEL